MNCFHLDRSIIIPPSHTALPATLCLTSYRNNQFIFSCKFYSQRYLYKSTGYYFLIFYPPIHIKPCVLRVLRIEIPLIIKSPVAFLNLPVPPTMLRLVVNSTRVALIGLVLPKPTVVPHIDCPLLLKKMVETVLGIVMPAAASSEEKNIFTGAKPD